MTNLLNEAIKEKMAKHNLTDNDFVLAASVINGETSLSQVQRIKKFKTQFAAYAYIVRCLKIMKACDKIKLSTP